MEFLTTLYFIGLVLLALAFLLYRPLPHDIADWHILTLFEIGIRFTLVYLGEVVEFVFGSEARVYVARTLMDLNYLLPTYPPEGIRVTKMIIRGIKCRIYFPKEQRTRGLFVYLHGGGWALGKACYMDTVIFSLIKRLGCVVVAPDYRLAPEHPYPVPNNDCESIIKGLYEEYYNELNIDREKIVLAGDSAGGHLAASVCQRLAKQSKMNYVKAQILIYPVTHVFAFHLPSFDEYREKMNGTGLLNPHYMARFILYYLGLPAHVENVKKLINCEHIHEELENDPKYQSFIGRDALPYHRQDKYIDKYHKVDSQLAETFLSLGTDADISPIFGVSESLCPTMVLTAEYDVLKDEGAQYAKRVSANGVRCEWKHYPTGYHGVLNMIGSKVRRQMISDIAAFSREFI